MFKVNYLEIIKKSWQTAWNRRYLWWFGLFVSLTGFGNAFNYSNRSSDVRSTEREAILNFIASHLNLFLAIVLILIVICIFFLVLSLIGRGALISGLGKEFKGELSNFKQEFRTGRKFFWRIFMISFVIGFFVLAIMIILAIPLFFLFYNHSYISGVLLTILAILIFIPIIILASFIRLYGYIYAVAGNLSFWDAVEKAYLLFSQNLWSSIVMGLIFVPIKILYVIIVVATILPIILIFILVGIVLFLIFKGIGALIAAGMALILIIAVVLFLRSIYETFAQGAWLLFFHVIAKIKITEEAEAEKEPATEIEPATTPDAA